MIHKILYSHMGELSYTQMSPVEPWRGQRDLGTTKRALFSSDDWRTVEIKKYEVREVCLPGWLSPEEYCCNSCRWDNLWLVVPQDTQEELQRFLVEERPSVRQAYWDLLKVKKYRSAFRASLADQVWAWLKTPEEERVYNKPLSPRQFGYIWNDRYRWLD